MGIQVKGLTENKFLWEKEYIDFEFDGKCVSEFGLVAVSDGDRYSFAASSDFEDEVAQVNGYNGQHYWGTNLKAKKVTYSLATDGMTEEQLNAFKRHFQPGKYGKFVDSHLSYRYSYCRLAEVVKFNFVPFRVKKTMLGRDFYVNEYKGDAQITFVWDTPYSYSKENYVEKITEETLRAIYTNGIPIPQSWVVNEGISSDNSALDTSKLGIMLLDSEGFTMEMGGCHLGSDQMLQSSGESGILVNDEGHSGNTTMIYYNPSTVDTSSTITMTFEPEFTPVNPNNWKPVYFNQIADDINITQYSHTEKRNAIQSSTKKEVMVSEDEKIVSLPDEEDYISSFYYSSPNVLYSINRVIQLAWQCFNKNTTTILELEELFRDEIAHEQVLSWAMSILSVINSHGSGQTFMESNGTLSKSKVFKTLINLNTIGFTGAQQMTSASWFAYFNILMLLFLGKNQSGEILLERAPESWNGFNSVEVVFNGQTLETTIKYNYNSFNQGIVKKFSGKEEKCGDMNQSKYLLLDGGDTINDVGETMSCHFIRFLKGGQVQNVAKAKLEYKYTYV